MYAWTTKLSLGKTARSLSRGQSVQHADGHENAEEEEDSGGVKLGEGGGNFHLFILLAHVNNICQGPITKLVMVWTRSTIFDHVVVNKLR